jgi:transcriptional regulator with XRE-family HTH domain
MYNSQDMISFYSPQELVTRLGERAKECRLALGRRQADVAEAAGVPLSTLKRFESGANVGVDVIARLALALGAERDLANLFVSPPPGTIDELLKRNRKRLRGKRAA